MTLRARRIRGVVRKEIREYRRNRSLILSMAVFPLIFLIQPLYAVLVAHPSASTLGQMHLLLYMLAIPILAPPLLAGSAVTGERGQGSLEPLLASPITREEFLLAKALAALAPSVLIAYAVYALFIVWVRLFADPELSRAVLQGPDIAAQVVFTPLLAALAIWVGIAVSTRTSDIRVAQQLSLLACLPLLVATSLVAFDVVHVTVALAVLGGMVLIVADAVGWRLVAPMFDRERLIRGIGA